MSSQTDTKLSPMMAQWQACKEKATGALLLFRLGDFYEAFHDDASTLSKELGVTLTKRQEIPMAGVPFHAGEAYIDKLVAKGYRVAVAEQMEDPRSVKGIVKREIVRMISPGTVIQSSLLCDKSPNFLAALSQAGSTHGLALLDLTTAEFKALEFDSLELSLDELAKVQPKEILISKKWATRHPEALQELDREWRPLIQTKEEWLFGQEHTLQVLLGHFKLHSLDGLGLSGRVAATSAAGVVLHYVSEELHLPVEHIRSIRSDIGSSFMQLDRTTQKHLELFSQQKETKESTTLLSLIDDTKTPMGGRLFKTWLCYPLLDLKALHKRQETIAELLASSRFEKIQELLKPIQDLERLMMRIETKCASPRDLAGLRFSLEAIAPLKAELSSLSSSLLSQVHADLSDVSSLCKRLSSALVDSPPLRLSEGNIFKTGFHKELDELKTIQIDSQSWIASYQTDLRERSQIKTLKVGYTKAFGYYIEVSRGQADRAPDFFERKQTLVNAERFITKELKEFEYKILHAEECSQALEQELFDLLRKEVASEAKTIYALAKALAVLDSLSSLASVAQKRGYVCPLVDESSVFNLQQSRHPVVEAVSNEPYIPNDLKLDGDEERLHLITGPNMAGKSTFIRQAALIAILAQMGSYVPAKSAHIGLIDKVFTRIGASDDLTKGQSTFMVEMTETANILNNATSKSLVILDEIGRGTSTYDGISIAWAVADYLLNTPGKQAKTLFATHYWELTELESLYPEAVNYTVAVEETRDSIVFLRKIIKGSADKSYGIHVAKLAGIPLPVLKRAEEVLKKLEQETPKETKRPAAQAQLSLFEIPNTEPHPLVEELGSLSPETLSPLQALELLFEWKKNHVL